MKESLLNKRNSLMLHGVAILMMIYHHLFIDGNYFCINGGKSFFDLYDSINIGNAPSAQLTFAWFCRICVAIFAFTSGYAMYAQYKNKYGESYKLKELFRYVLKRWWSFYKKFLLCFIIFIGYQYLINKNNGLDYSLGNVILNLLGIRASYNDTWWYIEVYYCMLLVSPFVYMLLNKFELKHYLIVIGIVLLSIVVAFVSGNLISYLKFLSGVIQTPLTVYLIIFMEGMFVARFGILDFIGSKLNFITSLMLLVITYIARALLIRAPSDPIFDVVLITPFVVSITKLFNYCKPLCRIFELFGKYSSYMWYNHAYFYSYLFYGLVVFSDYSILIFIQITLYSLLTAVLLTYIEKGLSILLNKLLKKYI